MKLGKLKQNVDSEVEGIWVDYTEGTRLKLARWGNKRYADILRKIGKPHRQAARNGVLSEKIAEELQARAAAQAVLLDWEGFENDDGTKMEYTPEVGLEVFMNPEYADFYTDVRSISQDRALFNEELQADAEGNSERT